MKPSTLEWVDKAEADYETALREFRARRQPNFDDACFHAQQCIEKYLKARLIEAGIAFPLSLHMPLHPLQNLLHMIQPMPRLADAMRLAGIQHQLRLHPMVLQQSVVLR